jgi:DNA-binding CsgD family transcriptional regulator
MTAPSDIDADVPGFTNRHSECAVLDEFVDNVRAGEGRALVVRGEPGVGKTVLLDYLAGRASGCRVVRAMGVQSEMELAFAGLHQLCAPLLDHAESLPGPQGDALRTAFGLSAGPVPDRFLVGLAVLGLLSEAAAERPLICVVDDEQWLDRASAQALGFVARRLGADPVGLVFAARVPSRDVAGLTGLVVPGLAEGDARALLESVLTGPLDARIRDQVIADTGGNPLALLELPRGLTPAQLAGGFGLPWARPLDARIEDSFARQLAALPDQARRLVQLAAADPSGDTSLVWRAAGLLEIQAVAAAPAAEAGLAEFGARVRFRHPLVRSAAYRSASVQARQEMHGALAEATDPGADPDRRAWHRAQAAPGPDEEVAAELERSAGRAQARGGLAAAAAFLERAALLTPGPDRRAQRMLAAARAKREAGAPDAALGLLAQTEVFGSRPLDELQAAQLEYLRGQIANDQRRSSDAARLLLSAARRLEPLNASQARETYLEALEVAMFVGDLFLPGAAREAAEAALAVPRMTGPLRPVDIALDALALLLTQGYAAAASGLRHALDLLLALDTGTGEARRWRFLAGGRVGMTMAMERCDWESLHTLLAGQARVARDMGALVQLRSAAMGLVAAHIMQGELSVAARLVEEERLIAEATGTPPSAITAMMLAAWRGREHETSELIETSVREGTAREQGYVVDFAKCAGAVLYNGLGRYGTARDAAWQAWERRPVALGVFAVPELAEAAARTGETSLVRVALAWVSERSQVMPTGWALGIEARVRALLSGDETGYLESIGHLARTRVRAQLARSHLLYGEWLRRENRRLDARAQLRTAHDMLSAMGAEGFAERARRELLATGETVRRRAVETVSELTAREAHIARLAVEGKTNMEIGAQLYLSVRTVEWHLRKVYTKLGIGSRQELRWALAKLGQADPQALCDVLGVGRLVGGVGAAEQAQLVQPPDPPHGPGMRSRQLGDSHPETAEVTSLVDQLTGLHVFRRVPAGGQQDQTQLALRLEHRAVPVARVLPQPGQRRSQDRDQLRVAEHQVVPQRHVMEPDVPDLVAEDEPRSFPVVITEIREQLVGQHDVVVGQSALSRERVKRAVAVSQVQGRGGLHAQGPGEVVYRAVQVPELSPGQQHGGPADRCPLHLADDHDRRSHQDYRPRHRPPRRLPVRAAQRGRNQGCRD